jgi:hypothetical protein
MNLQPIAYISATEVVSAETFFRPVKANFDAITSTVSGYAVVGAPAIATNYTPTESTVKGHLEGIDIKLGNISATTVTASSTPTNYTKITDSVQGHLLGIDTAIGTKQATITGGATTITSSNLTASRALVSDGSGKVAVSSTTSTEIGYVNGVTSAIQTQINGKEATISAGNTSQYWRGDKTWQTLNATVVIASGSPTNYTPITNSVQGHLQGIDNKIGTFTQVCIQTTRAMDAASGSVNIAHGLGRTPKYVHIIARAKTYQSGGDATDIINGVLMSDGWDNSGANFCTSVINLSADSQIEMDVINYNDRSIHIEDSYNDGTVRTRKQHAEMSFDATNVILNWTKEDVGTPVQNQTIYITIIVFG